VAEPVESGKPLGTFLRKVRRQDGSFTARKLTLDGIPGNGHKLYGWLKATADSLLPVPGQGRALPLRLSMEILTEYRDRAVNGSSDKVTHVHETKKQKKMTHTGTVTECYQPRLVRLRETSSQWVSECGLRFRKSTGAAVGSGVWSSRHRDLSSIREIQPNK
jgi:hypothetical protein